VLSTLIAALAIAVPAIAQELETIIVTATRDARSADDVGASIRAIGEEELAIVNAVHINEVMGRAPGTWISRGNGQEHLTAIRSPVFTGSGSCGAFYMAEDGIALRPIGYCNVNELSEATFELAQRVEVLRGPGTAVHGSNAQHGVINVISTLPGTGPLATLSVQGGPHGYARGQGSINQATSDEGGIRLDLNVTHDGGYKDHSGFNQTKAAAAWRGAVGDALVTTRLAYGNLDQQTAGFIRGEDAYKDSDLKKTNPNPEAYRENAYARWYARIEMDTADAGHLTITPYARVQEMEFLQHFLVGQPTEEHGSWSAGFQSAWRPATRGDIDYMVGIDAEYAEGYLKQTQAQDIRFSPVFPSGKHYDYDVDGQNLAAFTRVDWTLSNDLTLRGGVRLQRQEYDYDNRMIDGATRDDGTPCGTIENPIPCRYSRPADRSDTFNDVSWHLGASWQLAEQQELIATVASGFRPPEANELYRLQAGQVVADIDSEQADNVELGWRGRAGSLSYQLVGYYMEKEDTIFQDKDRRNVTGADTEHYGFEYSLSWDINARWQISADGSWSRHRYTNNPVGASAPLKGNDMDTAPRNIASARVLWRPLDTLSAELEWSHLGEYYLTETENQQYDGHNLLHLRVRHNFHEDLYYAVRVTNLTDEDYAERADFAFGSYRYFVGEPRGLYVEFGWSLDP